MGREHNFARTKYREALSAWLRRGWRPLLFLAALILAVCVVLAWLLNGYVLGLAQASVVVGLAATVLTAFHAHTGAIWQLAGAWGEDNTRDVLAQARRRRRIWGWVDGVATQAGDIDHLVVMRDGRIVAIDSKWHAVNLSTSVVQQDASKAMRAARQASLVLRHLDLPRTVIPLVVVWGSTGPTGIPAGARVDDVEFVPGRRLAEWLRQNDGAHVRKADAHRVLAELRGFKARVRPQAVQRKGALAPPRL